MDIFYPLTIFSKWLTYELLRLSQSHLAGALEFFIYDSLKIFLLIVIITTFMSLLRYYLPIEKLRNFLKDHKFYGLDYLLASIFGVITPFCSCSSIPLFIGFMEARIPLGVTFSFLITSPLINEIAIGLFIGMFGLKITLIYIGMGVLIGVIGGFVLGKLKMERYVEDFVWKIKAKKTASQEIKRMSPKIFKSIVIEAWDITKQIMPYVLVGVAVGGLIHGYIPEGFFEVYLKEAGWWGVPIAVLLAIPLYSNASGVIPIVQTLIKKGVPIGTGLAFMMATVGLSLPEAMILKKVLKWPLLVAFFSIVAIGIILIGYFFNILI